MAPLRSERMPFSPADLPHRQPVWTALSVLYVDTDVTPSLRYVAETIRASPYGLDDARRIDRDEVFPVLLPNLLSVAGEWAGFDPDWLHAEIVRRRSRRSWLGWQWNRFLYARFGWMTRADWQQIIALDNARAPT